MDQNVPEEDDASQNTTDTDITTQDNATCDKQTQHKPTQIDKQVQTDRTSLTYPWRPKLRQSHYYPQLNPKWDVSRKVGNVYKVIKLIYLYIQVDNDSQLQSLFGVEISFRSQYKHFFLLKLTVQANEYLAFDYKCYARLRYKEKKNKSPSQSKVSYASPTYEFYV